MLLFYNLLFSLNVKFIFYRKTRRRNHKEENFRVWYLSQKFASLKRKSQMRRYWVVWKADHNDLAATKRLIGRLMKINAKGQKAVMANILTSAQGMYK